MDKAHKCLVTKNDEGNMFGKITKGGDVTEASKGGKDQGIHAKNSWMIGIFMLTYLLFAFVTGKLICSNTDEDESSNRLIACQMKKEHKCFVKPGHVPEEPVDLLLT